jgi:argininosuccinate lyase
MSDILKGGRLSSTREDVVAFTSSIESDAKLLKAVLMINRAHVIMLAQQGILTSEIGTKLLAGLHDLSSLTLRDDVEDVHVALEEAITTRLGPEVGGNLHVAKSRNDQVATAIRIELRRSLLELMSSLEGVQAALIDLARRNIETIILGYTHLQPAQPVTFAHYLMAYVDALKRGLQRVLELFERVNLCPMGAGALATSSFPIDRECVADLLGFDDVLENSIDAVSGRDFVLETLGALAITAADISRFAEDMIIWASPHFGLIVLPEEFVSTSSIMPQKKNPDVLEVIRARAGVALGNFVTATTIMKGLPSSYNLDLQEITPKLWESLESSISSLRILSELIQHLKVVEKDFEHTQLHFATATELANLLVRKHSVPFRSAYKIVGRLVSELIDSGLSMRDADSSMIEKIAKDSMGVTLKIDATDLETVTDIKSIVGMYDVRGGPAPSEVKRMIGNREKHLKRRRSDLKRRIHTLEQKEQALMQRVTL